MDYTQIILGVVSALFGGGIGAYFTFKINSRKAKTSEFQLLLDERKEVTQSLTNRIKELEEDREKDREKINELEKEVQSLRHQLMIFESSHIDIPLPVWMKDTEGKMVFLNDVYENEYLIPRGYSIADYLGKNDYAVWSEEVAREFIKNDKEVMRTKKHIRTVEMLEDSHGNIYYVDLLKYPRKFNNTVIGISGIVLRNAKSKEELE